MLRELARDLDITSILEDIKGGQVHGSRHGNCKTARLYQASNSRFGIAGYDKIGAKPDVKQD